MSIESPKSSPSPDKIEAAATAQPAANARAGQLRLWPGVAILAALWIIRLVAGLAANSPSHFFFAYMIAPLVATALVLAWWLFASRLRWADRGLVVAVFAATTTATVMISRQTVGMGLLLYGVPAVLSVWVGWLLVTYWLRWPVRRAGLLAAIVLVCGLFTLLRVDGMTGTFTPSFSWRWSQTAEDRLLASLAGAPQSAAAPAVELAATSTAATGTRLELAPGDWPGFRGAARDGRLFGVEIATDWQKSPPRLLWRHLIGPGWSSFAVVGDRVFTQEQRGDDEMVVCYDALTGAEIWAHKDATRFSELVAGAGPRGTPTFDDGRIYALGGSGHLNCLDAATGALEWTHDVVADSGAELPQWGFSSSPLVVQGIVTVFAGGPDFKSVLGYQAKTGELAWAGGHGKLSYCSTQLANFDGVDQVLIASELGLTSLRPDTGEMLWQHAWPTDKVARIIQPAVLNTSDLLIGTGMGIGTRRIHVGHEGISWPTNEIWTSRAIKPYYNDLVVQGSHLYGFDSNIFMCVGWDDGKTRWRTRGSDNGAAYGNGQVLLVVDQSLLLILTETGEVALVEAQPEKFKEIARFQAIEGKTWNHPVIAHGKLFVRNAEEVACYELAPPAGQARAPEESSAR
ncbi:MAG TPA: PQQ-binding-like beta-propeller repeat protein [Pirellulales bacterium]|jgi:outer membrane protein assembly factor BamB|nr:PQQ-binding-like beta-propeller repeat protein [Pirellulales bacterium]